MADIGASRRRRSYGRRVCVAWVALSAASCADLLDLPSDPRLKEPAAQPVEAEPVGEGPGRGGSSGNEPLLSEGSSNGPSSTGSGSAGSSNAGPATGVADPDRTPPDPIASNGGDPIGAGTPDAGAPPPASPDAAAEEPAEPEAPEEPPSPCADPEIVGPNGRCFLVVEETLAWEDARSNCQSRGDDWDLAAIRDAEVNDFIGTLTDLEAWLGGSDASTEATWRWVNEGDAFWSGDGTTGEAVDGAFEAWNSDEPNGRGNSDCVRTVPIIRTGEGLTWADLECFELRASLCEGPPREL
jgi:lectin-like protein